MFKKLWGRFYDKFLKPIIEGETIVIKNPKAIPTPTPTPTPTPEPFYGRNPEVVAMRKSGSERYANFIKRLRKLKPTRLEGDFLTDLAFAESSLNPNLTHSESTAGGLYQFTNPTWQDYLEASRSAALAQHNKFVPEQATQAALYALRKGIKGQGLRKWEASRWNWGRFYEPEELEEFYY